MNYLSLSIFLITFVFLTKTKGKKKCDNSYEPRAILIGIDGLNPLYITEDNINLKWLIEHGASTMKARGAIEALSAPGWTQILCCMDSKLTGVVNNYWLPPWAGFGVQNITPVTGQNMPFPCVFENIKKQNINITTLYYYDWDWLQILGNQGMGPYIDFEYYPGNLFKDDMIIDNFTNLINDGDLPNFSVVYLGEVDSIGHRQGFGSPEYIAKVKETDIRIGKILDALKNSKLLEDVYIGVISDHGAVPGAFSHGEQNDANLLVPWIIYGPGIKENYRITSNSIITYDVIPTMLGAIELKSHSLWQGRIIDEIFNEL